MPIKKTTKKAKKVKEEIIDKPVVQPKYNEFGVCLACNGGNLECTHNNLIQSNQGIVCTKCGFKVK